MSEKKTGWQIFIIFKLMLIGVLIALKGAGY